MAKENVGKQHEIAVKMVLDAWHSKTTQLDRLLSELSDEQLLQEVAPDRNRGIYLLGHLINVADSAFPLLGYEKQAPHLWKPFVEMPDKESSDWTNVNDLRAEWVKVKTEIAKKIAAINADE